MSTDESLADVAVAETVDVSPEIDAEDFSWDDFLAGVRPTRRAVEVFARADLVAQMEEVAAPLLRRADDDETPLTAAEKKIAAEVKRLRAEFKASGRWFVAEARSRERIAKVQEEAAARHGITIKDEDGNPVPVQGEDWAKIKRAVLADAIVIPTGTTEERLERLEAMSPTEYPKLEAARTVANSKLAQSAEVLTRDFSHAPSAAPGSNKR